LQHAQHAAYRSVNGVMIQAYWYIGQKIVEHEQQGNDRAAYGTKLIPQLAKRPTEEFAKGFNATNLFYMKQFYLEFPILHALRGELTWTHYRLLLKVQNETARQYYLQESIG
jgi:predicted nuclease of restriction endonuclease-like (RecB) superfamily